MKKLLGILLVLALVLSFSLVATTPVAAEIVDVNSDMTTAQINTAIANAPIGATVKFAAGFYDLEEPLVIDRADVTIEGDTATPVNVTINAATIAGTDRDCFQVKADGVTIRGFRMQGAMDADAGAGYQNAAVVIGTHWDGPAIIGLQNIDISYNEITDCTRGIYVYRAQNVIISNNKIHGMVIAGANAVAAWPGKGIELKGDGDPTDPQINNISIFKNEIYNCQLIGIEINVWEMSGGAIIDAQVLIEDNTIYNNGGNWQGVLGFEEYVYRGISSNGKTKNVTIRDNRIYDHRSATHATGWGSWGIRLYHNPKDIEWTIVDNHIYDNHKGIWAVSQNNIISGNTITGNSIYGIRTLGDNIITCNTIANNGHQTEAAERSCGIWARPADVINFNSIYGNGLGVFYDRDDPLDATRNWWDHASGPYHDPLNEDGEGDAVSDNVLFVPWYFDEEKEIPVTSYDDVETETTTGTAAFGASAGEIEDLEAVPAVSPAPRGVNFPHGMFEFRVTGLDFGQTITVVIELPQAVPVGTVWWKHDGTRWYSLPIGRTADPKVITLTLTDGVFPGDMDGEADGTITDPGGPGNPVPLTVGWEGSSVNKAGVMAPWLALLATMMAGLSLLMWRRRRAQI